MHNRVVEHVWSQPQLSQIFNHIYLYFRQYGTQFAHISDADDKLFGKAEGNGTNSTADFRIYHRPHLAGELINPCACVVHHDLHDPSDAFGIEKFLPQYQRSDLTICINNTQRNVLKNLGVENTIVIHHGYNPILLRNRRFQRPIEKRKHTLGFVSRRYGRLIKGEPFLYELAIRLSPEKFDFLLIGQDRNIDADWLRSIGFDVACETNLPYPVLCSAYKEMDALLILSISEGGPACVPEALASGVPIIARPVGMVSDLFEVESVGLLLSDDAQKDAAAIIAFFEGDFKRVKRKLVSHHLVHDWKQTVQAYEEVIDSVIRGQSGA